MSNSARNTPRLVGLKVLASVALLVLALILGYGLLFALGVGGAGSDPWGGAAPVLFAALLLGALVLVWRQDRASRVGILLLIFVLLGLVVSGMLGAY